MNNKINLTIVPLNSPITLAALISSKNKYTKSVGALLHASTHLFIMLAMSSSVIPP
jgi:hypothetical protein